MKLTTKKSLLCATLAVSLAAPLGAQHLDAHDPRALAADPRLAEEPIAPALEGIGGVHLQVTTRSRRAQQFFDQGLNLTYGFNHQEALRAFKEAARLDPDLAMAYWGWALVLGPNLNLPMAAEVNEQAWGAIRTAMELADEVSPKERAFIEALATRYAAEPPADRRPLDRAYAEAMAALWETYPDDDEAGTLYAAAIMNTTPWFYWTRDGRPTSPGLPRAIEALETVVARNPRHVGALHYLIHIIEPIDPKRAEVAADLLRGLAPSAGHLVHMPSHVYMQVGRYAEAYEANARASAADESYIAQCRSQGIYPLNYYPHNLHFLAWAATLQGRSVEALRAARKLAARIPQDMHGNSWALYEPFLSLPIAVLVRFEMWEEVLAEPRPPAGRVYWTGLWHWARGMAYAHSDRLRSARKESAALERLLADPASAEVFVGFSNAETLLTIGRELLRGEILSRRGEVRLALASFERAVRLEESLPYAEPPTWFTPSRLYLADALLRADEPLEAEIVYVRQLESYPESGFALAGLARALAEQGRTAERTAVVRRLERAWAQADVPLTEPTRGSRIALLEPR